MAWVGRGVVGDGGWGMGCGEWEMKRCWILRVGWLWRCSGMGEILRIGKVDARGGSKGEREKGEGRAQNWGRGGNCLIFLGSGDNNAGWDRWDDESILVLETPVHEMIDWICILVLGQATKKAHYTIKQKAHWARFLIFRELAIIEVVAENGNKYPLRWWM